MRRVRPRIAWPMALALLASAGAAHAQGDPAKGEKVFAKCKICHVLDEQKNKIGPYLVGIFGRAAGTVDDFKNYSDAMKSSGIVWDDETLAAYLADPKAYIPGNRMAFPGLKKQEDIQDLVAYLHAQAE
jgi:cytochrome c